MKQPGICRQITHWFRPSRPLRDVPSRSGWQQLYNQPLVDLGTIGGEHLRGIFSPRYHEAQVQRYVHEQFREKARTYAAKYAASAYFASLLSNAFQKIGWKEHSECLILDIGSGAGNSIFPLLDLNRSSTVIASDLSVELLALLKEMLHERALGHRCGLLQLNAEQLDFAPESFDMVVGAAILHHLFHPDRTLRGCARILKPGGYAVFFEPFENGHSILNLIYQSILEEGTRKPLTEDVAGLLRALLNDNTVRRGRRKSSEIYKRIDDKWLFTKSYIQETAERAGFSECRIYPLHSPEKQFARQIEVNLRLGLGKERGALPQWAWKIAEDYDNCFSSDLKKDLLIEGGVILRK